MRSSSTTNLVVTLLGALLACHACPGCGKSAPHVSIDAAPTSSGGSASGGTSTATGGSATGGSMGSGGAPAIGGMVGTGGNPGDGGEGPNTGGTATGGTSNSGGTMAGSGGLATGGGVSTGGNMADGGGVATGGGPGTGGSRASGGAGGSGGVATSGGPGTGGTRASGGAGGGGVSGVDAGGACSCAGGETTLECFCKAYPCTDTLASYAPDGGAGLAYTILEEYADCNLVVVSIMDMIALQPYVFDRTTGRLVGRKFVSDIAESCRFGGESAGYTLTAGQFPASTCVRTKCVKGTLPGVGSCP